MPPSALCIANVTIKIYWATEGLVISKMIKMTHVLLSHSDPQRIPVIAGSQALQCPSLDSWILRTGLAGRLWSWWWVNSCPIPAGLHYYFVGIWCSVLDEKRQRGEMTERNHTFQFLLRRLLGNGGREWLCLLISFSILNQGYFSSLLLEREERREEGRERNINAREKHWLITSCERLDWGSDPQPRYVPWSGIKHVTFPLLEDTPTNWTTPARQLFDY